MPDKPSNDLDFARLVKLAGDDPAAFERLRERLIEALIASAPPDKRRRLRGLQWRIDQERARSRTPMAACLRISSMMWDSVLGPDGLVEALQALASGDQGKPERPSATVLDFPTRDEDTGPA